MFKLVIVFRDSLVHTAFYLKKSQCTDVINLLSDSILSAFVFQKDGAMWKEVDFLEDCSCDSV